MRAVLVVSLIALLSATPSVAEQCNEIVTRELWSMHGGTFESPGDGFKKSSMELHSREYSTKEREIQSRMDHAFQSYLENVKKSPKPVTDNRAWQNFRQTEEFKNVSKQSQDFETPYSASYERQFLMARDRHFTKIIRFGGPRPKLEAFADGNKIVAFTSVQNWGSRGLFLLSSDCEISEIVDLDLKTKNLSYIKSDLCQQMLTLNRVATSQDQLLDYLYNKNLPILDVREIHSVKKYCDKYVTQLTAKSP